MNRAQCCCLATILLASAGCQTVKPYDYSNSLECMPRSILVLPPLDETPEVNACYGWLSTATRPLAEYGYYVFPVAVVDRMLRENGLPTAGEMHQVSLQKLDEVFGADAVLYVTVTDWGTSYKVLTSDTTVSVHAKLVDIKTGSLLWEGRGSVTQSSSQGNQGLLGMMVSAVVNQVATSVSLTRGTSRTCEKSRTVNRLDTAVDKANATTRTRTRFRSQATDDTAAAYRR